MIPRKMQANCLFTKICFYLKDYCFNYFL